MYAGFSWREWGLPSLKEPGSGLSGTQLYTHGSLFEEDTRGTRRRVKFVGVCSFSSLLKLGEDSDLMDFVHVFVFQDKSSQEKSVPKASRDLGTDGSIPLQRKEVSVSGVKIFYGSQTGTAKVRTSCGAFPWVS